MTHATCSILSSSVYSILNDAAHPSLCSSNEKIPLPINRTKKPKYNFNLNREKITSGMESEPSFQTEKGVVIRRYGTTRYIQEAV